MLMVLELTPTYIPSSFLKTRYLGFQSLEKIGKIKGEDESKRERDGKIRNFAVLASPGTCTIP